jgi:hypothetical protein
LCQKFKGKRAIEREGEREREREREREGEKKKKVEERKTRQSVVRESV